MSLFGSRKLRAGDLVEIKTASEIAATLGSDATVDALPFMPEMLRHCGQRVRVFKRSHKTCDTIHRTGNRRIDRTVHLEGLRCDGSAHGGCQAGCLLFWKQEWLRPVSASSAAAAQSPEPAAESKARLDSATQRPPEPGSDAPVYRCQATELFAATRPIRRWELLHYLEDLTSGNVGLREFARVSLIALFNFVQGLRGGSRLPRFAGGRIEGRTPKLSLGLQPGDLVEVRSAEEIAETLDTRSKNRGLFFDYEMIPSCGGRYRVARRVERIIDERSGQMVELKSDCVVLDGVACRALYSKLRLFCPRHITPYWREIWLRKIEETGSGRGGGAPQ